MTDDSHRNLRRRRDQPVRARAGAHATLAMLLLLLASPSAAELPIGWSVEIFAGAIQDMVADGTILVGATGGGLLLHDTQANSFAQIADAGCVDGDCLRSNQLTSLARDTRGQYWVGSVRSGLTVVRPPLGTGGYGHFFEANLSFGGGLLSDSVIAVDVWLDETVYVATTRGVAQIDIEGALENYNAQASRRLGQDGFPAARIHDLVADSTFVWVASDAGMFRYLRKPPFTVSALTAGYEGVSALSVKMQQGNLYAGTDVGLLQWNETAFAWQRIQGATNDSFEVLNFVAVAPLSSGDPLRFAAGSVSEVWFYNGFAWGRLSPPALPLLADRTFPAMTAIGDSIWTSQVNDSDEGAFLELLNAAQLPLVWERREKSSIPPSGINRVGIDVTSGDAWVGTQFGGVARRNSAQEWCVYNGNDADVAANMSDPQGRVEAMLIDSDGDAWFTPLVIATAFPVDRLRGDPACDHTQDLWSHITPGAFGFGGRYWEIEADGLANRFFLSDGEAPSPGGIDVISRDLSQHVNIRSDLLGGNAIGALVFDRQVGTWEFAYVGVNNRGNQGLLRWRNSNDIFSPSSANFTVRNLPIDINEYRDIVVDQRGGREHLWIASGEGLIQYDLNDAVQDTLRTLSLKLSAKPGLLSSDIRDLQLDDLGSLWIATTNGVNRINLDELAASGILMVDAFSTRETVGELNATNPAVGRLYDPVETVKPLPSSSVISLAFDASRSELHIGTSLGLAILDVERIDVRPSTPVDKAFVFPNPLRVLDGDEAMYVGGINEKARVRVYNLEGELVFERIDVEPVAPGETPGFENEAWDLKTLGSTTQGFFNAAPGLYMVRIETSQGSKVTSVAVIR